MEPEAAAPRRTGRSVGFMVLCFELPRQDLQTTDQKKSLPHVLPRRCPRQCETTPDMAMRRQPGDPTGFTSKWARLKEGERRTNDDSHDGPSLGRGVGERRSIDGAPAPLVAEAPRPAVRAIGIVMVPTSSDTPRRRLQRSTTGQVAVSPLSSTCRLFAVPPRPTAVTVRRFTQLKTLTPTW